MGKLESKIYSSAIIGAGFAGLGAAIRLKKAGINDFVILERANDIGGTWRDNIYPGCSCDVPSHLYSYSFELNPDWSRNFSRQQEILSYIKSCAEKHDVMRQILFEKEVTQIEFDNENGCWQVTDSSGHSIYAKTVVAAIGPLNVPKFPIFYKREIFNGVSFHSSEWDKAYDFNGKRVAVVGTGASAIQLVPELAKKTKKLIVFQRTPPWILPKSDGEIPILMKRIFRYIPGVLWLWRELIYWFMELRGIGLFGNKFISKTAAGIAIRHIKNSISDPSLRAKVTPDYQIGCKRVLPSNSYYPSLERKNVELITAEIQELNEDGIKTKSGQQFDVDCIVYATGFDAAEYSNRNFNIIGISKRKLMEEWKSTGPEAYLGITVSGFPGLLFMAGPNTGLGHNSIIHMMESQANYIEDYIKILMENNHAYLDVKKEVQDDYNKLIQQELSSMVWATGCKSWYQTPSGKNTTIWPGHTFKYRKLTKRVNLSDYNLINQSVRAT